MKFSSSHTLKHKKQQVKFITYLTEHTEDVIPSACNQYTVTETGTPSVWYEFCHPLGTGLPPASQLGQGIARGSPEVHQQLTVHARGWWGGRTPVSWVHRPQRTCGTGRTPTCASMPRLCSVLGPNFARTSGWPGTRHCQPHARRTCLADQSLTFPSGGPGDWKINTLACSFPGFWLWNVRDEGREHVIESLKEVCFRGAEERTIEPGGERPRWSQAPILAGWGTAGPFECPGFRLTHQDGNLCPVHQGARGNRLSPAMRHKNVVYSQHHSRLSLPFTCPVAWGDAGACLLFLRRHMRLAFAI